MAALFMLTLVVSDAYACRIETAVRSFVCIDGSLVELRVVGGRAFRRSHIVRDLLCPKIYLYRELIDREARESFVQSFRLVCMISVEDRVCIVYVEPGTSTTPRRYLCNILYQG